MLKNYYAILRVSPNASQQEIDLSYRRLSEKYHPTYRSDPSAYMQLKELNEAWRVLSDPYQRRRYDTARKNRRNSNYQPPESPWLQSGATGHVPPRSADRTPIPLDYSPRLYPRRRRIPAPLLAIGALLLIAGNVVGVMSLLSFINQPGGLLTMLTARATSAPTGEPTAVALSKPSSGDQIVHPCPNGCAAPLPDCRVKGDVDQPTSARLYYLPGDVVYDNVTIDADLGERWFCNEEDAQQNGWTRGSSTTLVVVPTRRIGMITPTPTDRPTPRPHGTATIVPTAEPATMSQPVAGAPAQFKYPAPQITTPTEGTRYSCKLALLLRWTPSVNRLGLDEWYLVESRLAGSTNWFPISDWLKQTAVILRPVKDDKGCDAAWWPDSGLYELRVSVITGNPAPHTVTQYLSPPSRTFTITYTR
ncbi:MAG TPA: J domain-containing protein [Anaerolineae bacterium]|nr:J domain-containing protein [Anaerolineae bacterium]